MNDDTDADLDLDIDIDIDIASDSNDARTDLTQKTFRVANDSVKSPWKDEIEHTSDTNSCDTDCDSIGSRNANRNERRSPEDNVSRRNTLNAKEYSSWPSTCAPRFKWSVVGKKKAQKYHWSGTFNDRLKKYSSFSGRMSEVSSKALSSSLRDIVDDSNYNNLDAFVHEKFPTKTKLFVCDKLNVHGENAKRHGSRSSAEIHSNEFNIPQQIWNTCDRRQSVLFDEDLRTRRTQQQQQEDDWETSNLSNTAKKDAPATDRETRCRLLDDPFVVRETTCTLYFSKRWIGKLSSSRCCNCLLAILKNLLLFSLLPSAYVAFFLYAGKPEEQ